MTITSLYIHIPFCLHRCGYCDFNTYAGQNGLIPDYARAVCKELAYISRNAPKKIHIHTVYFGGGTPSLLPISYMEDILQAVKDNYDLSPSPEITLEANPGTLTLDYLRQIVEVGVKRLSLGMQSAHSTELALLNRQHTFSDVIQAVEWSRAAGIGNLSLDLIFGLPGQHIQAWQDSLESALSLQPEHLSLYALTLEHGTPLQHAIASGRLPVPDPDVAADMYEEARDRMEKAGYVHYEISNWARRSSGDETFTCLHNLQYWRTLPYLGVGAGAHGFIHHHRTVNVAAPGVYITQFDSSARDSRSTEEFPATPATSEFSFVSQDDEIGDMMMMGLRLVQEGVSNKEFEQRYGMPLEVKFSFQIERLISFNLLEWAGPQADRLRLTTRGQLLGNQVFNEFI